MASRTMAPTQSRGEKFAPSCGIDHLIDEAVIRGGAKQQQKKKNGGADGRNRKALGDIGNMANVGGIDGKPPYQISRPITRSFCAQILANAAQAAAAAKNRKKKACVEAKAAPAKAVIQEKAPAKAKANKPVEVIEISPDADERAPANGFKQEEAAANKRKDGGGWSRREKENRSLTSVLSARSKAACGIAKEQIVDIDAADADNELAAVEYVEDLYRFYREAESENSPANYMQSQPELSEKMRMILVDWLVEIHRKFKLMPETLYLTINIIDRFLSVKPVPRRELQLLGIGALLTASKYEEIWAPEVSDLVMIADQAYSREQILAMEKTILGKLEWCLTVPTHYVFLVRFVKAAVADRKLECTAYFLMELGLMNYSILKCSPSTAAASAVYAARCTLGMSPSWNGTLKLHTGYSEAQIMDCAKLLVSIHSKAKDSKLHAIYKKYSSSQREAVALLSPARVLLDEDHHPAKASSTSPA
ncbi:hypothetical protein SAY86_017013 [Trapa natans]|uniref:Cyclin N-terminal domain-containing protein n=1 Tax=Trapa natans TaxID=22666 RepID=A0AAN7R2B9_TRANT|nr:hypothetical protein SAY86_017013 [Trapa natans]